MTKIAKGPNPDFIFLIIVSQRKLRNSPPSVKFGVESKLEFASGMKKELFSPSCRKELLVESPRSRWEQQTIHACCGVRRRRSTNALAAYLHIIDSTLKTISEPVGTTNDSRLLRSAAPSLHQRAGRILAYH